SRSSATSSARTTTWPSSWSSTARARSRLRRSSSHLKTPLTCCTSLTPVASKVGRCCCQLEFVRPTYSARPPRLASQHAETSHAGKEKHSMATTSVAVQRAATGRKYGAIDWWGGWRTCILACLGFSALFIALGLYMHAFAWSAGIDASSPEFALYWRSLLILELVG